jgi:outer membrane protein OmpA-like peptidoglycan-associated protein
MRLRLFAAVAVLVALGAGAACASRRAVAGAPGPSAVILLADPDTSALGRATVTSTAGAGTVELVTDRQATTVTGRRAPVPPAVLAAADVDKMFGGVLAGLPVAPQSFTLHFRLESNELTDESRVLLPGVLQAIASRPAPEVGVVGHTDTTGDARSNYTLGLDRANTVRTLLVGAGVDPSLIDVGSHGESELRIPTADDVLEPRNRRVEISVR